MLHPILMQNLFILHQFFPQTEAMINYADSLNTFYYAIEYLSISFSFWGVYVERNVYQVMLFILEYFLLKFC